MGTALERTRLGPSRMQREESRLSKYLVLYRSSVAATEQMAASDPDGAQAGMELWMNWAGRVGGAMADMGSPLGSVATLG